MQPRLLKHPARLAGASLLRLQDDNRLVALAREGHDPAFAAIVDRYRPQLERYCARLLGPGRAEDAVQQAFVNAHAAMKTTEQELVLKPWLYRIAHNAALNMLRASKGEETVLGLEHAGAVQTADVVELREQLRETLASIQALPAAQRDALLLRELEGRSHEEIALALGVTAGGARQHLHRARMSLRAAASAITPYPILSRILNAAADEGGRSADLVSGAGMGLGAGGVKAATAVLAAGALAGGAVGVHHHHHRASAKDPAAQVPHVVRHAVVAAAAVRHTTALASAPAATRHGAPTHSSHGTSTAVSVGGRHRTGSSELHRSGSSHDGAGQEVEHHGGSGSTPTKSTDDHSGSGGGSDDHVTTTATTTNDNSGPGSISDDVVTSGSGSDDGMTQTSTTDDHSGSDGSTSGTSGRDGGSDDPTTTTTDG